MFSNRLSNVVIANNGNAANNNIDRNVAIIVNTKTLYIKSIILQTHLIEQMKMRINYELRFFD